MSRMHLMQCQMSKTRHTQKIYKTVQNLELTLSTLHIDSIREALCHN